MDWLAQAWEFLRHLDGHLNEMAVSMGPWFYVVLFAIVFAETGLVILPFLPGDSLLFIVGTIGAKGDVNLVLAACVLSVAAILGDAVNYSIGRRVGPRVFCSETSRWVNRKHLLKAEAFYEKYGAKTIVIARFVPIVRTFAPFVAGIGRMRYPKFALYNVAGGLFWVWSLTLAGYFLSEVPVIKKNPGAVSLTIIAVSVLPVVVEWWRARRSAARDAARCPPPA